MVKMTDSWQNNTEIHSKTKSFLLSGGTKGNKTDYE